LSLPLMLNKSLFVPTMGGEEKIVSQKALWRALRLIPGILPFMLAFFLFNDAVTTLTNNYSIVTSNLFHISSSQLSLVTLLVIIMAGFGGLAWGAISDKIGAKKALIFLLLSWVIFLPALALAQKYQLYFIFSLAAGLSIGGTSTVSRQILTLLLPERILNYGFGIYAISERASTIFGPLAWTAVLSLSGYRAAIMSMVVFQIISVILISKLPKTKV
ncbi:MAG: MFS transporter, partial [Candidatus Komeilibacteria bacterium]|nr:MFS transporter [Candidatus Komeilibacteria bacterium]